MRVNTIGITTDDDRGKICVSVRVGNCPVYLHGTHASIKLFGESIINAASDSFKRSIEKSSDVNTREKEVENASN